MPERVRRRRTRGWTMPPNTVDVTRSTEWGNSFRIVRATNLETRKHEWWVECPEGMYRAASREQAHEWAARLFRHWVHLPPQSKLRTRARLALKGKNLACWCAPEFACHSNVWLEIVNANA